MSVPQGFGAAAAHHDRRWRRPLSAPPATEIPSFYFPGGREGGEPADAVTVYKSEIEETLKAKWNRPEDMADSGYVAEVDISVSPDKEGQLSNPACGEGVRGTSGGMIP